MEIGENRGMEQIWQMTSKDKYVTRRLFRLDNLAISFRAQNKSNQTFNRVSHIQPFEVFAVFCLLGFIHGVRRKGGGGMSVTERVSRTTLRNDDGKNWRWRSHGTRFLFESFSLKHSCAFVPPSPSPSGSASAGSGCPWRFPPAGHRLCDREQLRPQGSSSDTKLPDVCPLK